LTIDRQPAADPWRIRITDGNGHIMGSAVLVTTSQAVTCAHVIAGPGRVEHPQVQVTLDFPASNTGATVVATVPPDGWFPALESGVGDVAVLELADAPPHDVTPALLAPGAAHIGRVALAYGHPAEVPEGVWTRGTIIGSGGPHGEWLQLSGGLGRYDERVEQGFSGGGVVDEVTRRVVGIVVAAHTAPGRRLAWMVPMEVVARYWSPMSRLLVPQPDGTGQLDAAAVTALVEAFNMLRAMTDEMRRQRVVHLLPDAVRAALPRSTVPDTFSIVAACLRVAGGLAELADLVRYIEGPSDRIGPLDRLLREFGFSTTRPDAGTTARTEPLDLDAHRRLLEAFLRLPGVQLISSRRQYVDMLARYLRRDPGIELDFTVTDDARVDVWQLIDRLHPIPGGMRLFRDCIQVFEKTKPGFGELNLLIEALYPEPLLTDAERAELVWLLRSAPARTVTAAHRFAAPRHGTGVDAEHGSLEEVIRSVESYAQPPDRPPRIILFVEYLAHQLGTAGALHRWIDRTAARLRLPENDVRAVCRAARAVPVQAHRYQLILDVAPDAIDADRYLLSAALQRDSEPQQQLAVGDRADEPAPLSAVVARIDELLRGIPRRVNYELDGFSVEMILPRSLLTEPVDRWEFTDLIPYAVGTRHPVIVRSRDRLRRDDLWPQWRRKWDAVKRQGVADRTVLYFHDQPGELTPAQLRDLLWAGTLVLCLGYPLPAAPDLTTPDAFAAALAAGVPVIAWCRDAEHAAAFRAAVTGWVARSPVRDLTGRVFGWRQEARESPESAEFGRHISLVWCDADRVPEQFVGRGRLGPPVQRG
jgi:vWA-MoxR associated protein C-terminal domain/Trypsin-like peptidase domain/Effector-associated domain 2/vWA-MoxR associated protein middle region 0